MDALGPKCAGHLFRIGLAIVIPQDRSQSVWSTHLAKDLSTWFGGTRRLGTVSDLWY